MTYRVSFVLSKINREKLTKIHAAEIEEGKTTSFSKILNDVLSVGLKNFDISK